MRALCVLVLVLAVLFGAMPALAADKPVTLQLWDFHVHDKKFRKNIFNQFNKDNPDIKVVYTSQIGDGFTTMLDAAFRSGTPPDIFTPGMPAIRDKLVKSGWIIPLDDIAPSKEELQKWMAKFNKDQQPFVEGFNVFNGKVYSWPTGTDGGRMMIFWNTKLFREAGLKGPGGAAMEPETWEDTRLAARKITELGQGKTYGIIHGIKDGGWDIDLYYSLAPAAGWAFMHGFDFRTGLFDFHHAGLRGSIQLWLDMRKDGSIFPGDLSMDRETAKFRFSQNLAGMTLDGPWLPAGLISMNDSLEFDTALPPVPKRGTREGGLPVGPLAGNSEYYVSNKIESPTAVWKVVQFMTSQAYQEGWVAAGGGFSVFPEYNKPEYFPHPTMAKIALMGAEGRRSFPEIVWSPKMLKVWGPVIYDKPDYWEVIQGMWVGVYDWKTWDEMEVRDNKKFDEVLAGLNKTEGLNLKRSDYVFPDWDPTKPFGATASKKK